jgi:hypothetical protein
VSGTTHVDKTLGNNVRRQSLGIVSQFLYAREIYKDEDASLICFNTVLPIHGAQDVSATPFTHTPSTRSLSLPDTARHSACHGTRFVHFLELMKFFNDVAVRKRGRIAQKPPS